MLKRSLSDFEQHLSAPLRESAQRLAGNGAVTQIQEIERHFWVAKVREEDLEFETEVIISPARIKAFACECWSAPRKRMCVHIAATLLVVRRFLQQSASEKERNKRAQKQEPPAIARISMPLLLDKISPAQLNGFIQDYAKKDPAFAIAFKTRFADVLEEHPNAYRAVIQSLLPKKIPALKATQYRHLLSTLNELQLRLETAEKEGEITTVYKIASALLLSLTPILGQVDEAQSARLQAVCTDAFRRLTLLWEMPLLAPELKNAIWSDWLATLQIPGITPDFERAMCLMVARFAAIDQARHQAIAQLYQTHETPGTGLFHLYLFTLAEKKQTDQMLPIILAKAAKADKGYDPYCIVQVLMELFHAKYLDATDQLAVHCAPALAGHTGSAAEIQRLRLHIAGLKGNRQVQVALLSDLFIQTGQESHLQQIKELTDPSAWQELRAELLGKATAAGMPERVAQLLAFSKEQLVLAAWLETQQRMDWTLRYAPELTDAQLRHLLLPLLEKHLTEHFGRPAAEHIKTVLHTLLQQKRPELVRKIIQHLAAQFRDRIGLAEMLEEVF